MQWYQLQNFFAEKKLEGNQENKANVILPFFDLYIFFREFAADNSFLLQ